jgi:predicted RNase H-like HicB family nuclease
MIVQTEKEPDCRCLAEIPDLPGVMTCGAAGDEAVTRAKALALRVMADRLDGGDEIPDLKAVFTVAP